MTAVSATPSNSASASTGLPDGVVLRPLELLTDNRGSFMEMFRSTWAGQIDPIQWNVSRSDAGVLRGVHVHPRHDDYLTVVQGSATIGLRDLRVGAEDAPGTTVTLNGDAPSALRIPHGVAHGFYFAEPTLHVLGVSHFWDQDDELGCRWNDPDLGIPWPTTSAVMSDRDASLPALADLRAQLRASPL